MKVWFTPIISGARNKVGDAVFSVWKGIAYVRTRVIPHNPKSDDQMVVRNSLARCVPLWRSLEEQIKDVLDTYANDYQMSGFNWFISKNRVLEETFHSQVITPPNRKIDAVTTLAGAAGESGAIDLTWLDGTVGADYKVYVLYRKWAELLADSVFTLFQKETTLVSLNALTIDGLTPGAGYCVMVIVEHVPTSAFSASAYTVSLAGS